jgi:hypothetical protein
VWLNTLRKNEDIFLLTKLASRKEGIFFLNKMKRV